MGRQTKINAAEATLNWQTSNSVAQNSLSKKINQKVSVIQSKIQKVEDKVDENARVANEKIKLL